MQHIKTIHIILCGLLSGTIIASEKNTYLAVPTTNKAHKANTSQSRNSPQQSSPIPIISKPSKTIPLKKRYNSPYSSSYSPKYPQASPQQNSFPEYSTSPSLTSTDPYSILVNKFFVEAKGKYHLIDKNGTLDREKYITDEDKSGYSNYYNAQLVMKDNETFVNTTHLTSRGFKSIDHQSSVRTKLNDEQKKRLQKSSQRGKAIIASDDFNSLYYILSCVSNSSDSSEQS